MTAADNNDDQAAAGGGGSCACGAGWRLPLMLAVVLAAIVAWQFRGIRSDERDGQPDVQFRQAESDAAGRTVSLAIHFGDGRERRFDGVAWHQGMSVDDLLTAASRSADGIRYTIQGYRELTLLTSIDDVANEGTGGRNWTYSVNGERADRSFAVYQLAPSDHVLWTFGTRQ